MTARLEVLQVLDVDRVGRVVRERAVELAEQELELEGQPRHHRGDDEATHPVGGVGDDPQRRQRRDVDERPDVGDERGQQVATLDPARVLAALEETARNQRLDLGEAGVLADGRGAGPAQLHAVVLGGVVAGGEHRGRRVEGARGEVAEVGGREPEVDDVGAGDGRALDEGGGQRFRRRACVAARRGPAPRW